MGGKASIDFKPFDGFKISAIVAPRFNYDKFKTFKKAASYTLADDPNTIGGYLDNSGLYNTTKLSETRNDSYNVTTQLIANYAKKFAGKHDINLMAGYENYYEYIEELGADRDGYVLTNFPYLNNGPKDLIGNSGKEKSTLIVPTSDVSCTAMPTDIYSRLIYVMTAHHVLQRNTDGVHSLPSLPVGYSAKKIS